MTTAINTTALLRVRPFPAYLAPCLVSEKDKPGLLDVEDARVTRSDVCLPQFWSTEVIHINSNVPPPM